MNITDIRGAVAVARYHDEKVREYQQVIIDNVESRKFLNDDYLVDVESCAQSIWNHQSCATAIRSSIRAALALGQS